MVPCDRANERNDRRTEPTNERTNVWRSGKWKCQTRRRRIRQRHRKKKKKKKRATHIEITVVYIATNTDAKQQVCKRPKHIHLILRTKRESPNRTLTRYRLAKNEDRQRQICSNRFGAKWTIDEEWMRQNECSLVCLGYSTRPAAHSIHSIFFLLFSLHSSNVKRSFLSISHCVYMFNSFVLDCVLLHSI